MTDPFGAPKSEFTGLKDLVGRLVLIQAKTILKGIPSTQKGAAPGSTYEAVYADVIVLDGPTSEKIETVPGRLYDIRLSGAGLVPTVMADFEVSGPTMAPRKGGTGEFDVKPKNPAQPYILARIAKKDSSYGTPQWDLAAFSEADVPVARAGLVAIQQQDAAKAAASAAAAPNPFGAAQG